MKWQMLGLGIVGVLAAGSASVLIASMREGGFGSLTKAPDVAVVTVSRDLSASSIVPEDGLVVTHMPAKQAPGGALTDPLQAVGRVLTVPVIEGQVLTMRHFAPEGSGQALASKLPEGMRAVSISLADYSRLDGLLYPGSIVDVLGTFQVSARQRSRFDTVSVTLLHAIQVLAVQDEIVAANDGTSDANKTPSTSGRGRQRVTLLVTPRQAQALQLATEHGQVSLALRNPKDDLAPADDVLRIADISQQLRSLLGEPERVASETDGGAVIAPDQNDAPTLTLTSGGDAPTPAPGVGAPAAAVGTAPAQAGGNSPAQTAAAKPSEPKVEYWTTTVMRGAASEERQFPIEEKPAAGSNP